MKAETSNHIIRKVYACVRVCVHSNHAIIKWSFFKVQRSKIYDWKGLDALITQIDIKTV